MGAALVGTFLGILVAYGFVGPIATAMEHRAHEEGKAFEVVKMALVASVRGYAPPVAVEFARKLLFTRRAPDLRGPRERTCKGKKEAGRSRGGLSRHSGNEDKRPIIIVKREARAAAATTAARGRSPTPTS